MLYPSFLADIRHPFEIVVAYLDALPPDRRAFAIAGLETALTPFSIGVLMEYGRRPAPPEVQFDRHPAPPEVQFDRHPAHRPDPLLYTPDLSDRIAGALGLDGDKLWMQALRHDRAIRP